MANYFNVVLGNVSPIELTAQGINNGDQFLYIRIDGGTNTLDIGTKVRTVLAPSGYDFSDEEALYKLQGPIINDITSGIYSLEVENNQDKTIPLLFKDIKISSYQYENTGYRLYWIIQRGTNYQQGSYSGFYTYPHNIQPSEIEISGSLTVDNKMKYKIHWNPIGNERNEHYHNGYDPYLFSVAAYKRPILSEIYYPSGTMLSGIYFDLDFYNPYSKLPETYYFTACNIGFKGNRSTYKEIVIDHNKLINTDIYFKNLDDVVFSSANPKMLKLVDEKIIDKEVLDRKRLSIGINDISVQDNVFVKQGAYVSPYYPLDVNLYTFSLKTIENIPNYPELDPYNVVQYFIEINSKWERISPINRGDEFDSSNILVPKILVFDKGINDNSQVKYIDSGIVKIFRIKIVFDLSGISEAKFVPPEIHDFKCIIYDKDQLNEL